MFSRGKGESDNGNGETGPEDQGTRVTSGSRAAAESAAEIDALLRRLDEAAHIEVESNTAPLKRVADQAAEQANALHATADAQKQAQRMLDLATKEREQVSAQAEQILTEARDAAARLQSEAERHAESARSETRQWATEQRNTIDAVIGELIEVATQDAARIRTDAERSAMDDARKTARQYIARAAAIGAHDADEIRGQAREVLDRSSAAAARAHTTMQEFADSMAGFLSVMSEHLEVMDQVHADAAAKSRTAAEAPPITLTEEDLTGSTPAPADADSQQPDSEAASGAASGATTGAEEAAGTPDQVEDQVEDRDAHRDLDRATGEEVAGDSTTAPEVQPQQPGRPLGSLFRGPGHQ